MFCDEPLPEFILPSRIEVFSISLLIEYNKPIPSLQTLFAH